MPAAPAAMRQLADLRDQMARIERLRLRLIDGQPVQGARTDIVETSTMSQSAAAGRVNRPRRRAQPRQE